MTETMKVPPFIELQVRYLLIGVRMGVDLKEQLLTLTLPSLTEWAMVCMSRLCEDVETDYNVAELEMLRMHVRLNYTDEEYRHYTDYLEWYGEQHENKHKPSET